MKAVVTGAMLVGGMVGGMVLGACLTMSNPKVRKLYRRTKRIAKQMTSV